MVTNLFIIKVSITSSGRVVSRTPATLDTTRKGPSPWYLALCQRIRNPSTNPRLPVTTAVNRVTLSVTAISFSVSRGRREVNS